MKSTPERVSYLFNRYYEKTATDIEKKELFLSLEKFSDEDLSLLMARAFNKLDRNTLVSDDLKANEELNEILKILNEILKIKPLYGGTAHKPTIKLWRKAAIAASVLLILSFGIYFYTNKEVKTSPQITQKNNTLLKDALPGTNKAVLTLGDGSTIVLNDAKDGVLANQGNIVVNKTKDGQISYSKKSTGLNTDDIKINKITTPRGGQYQVVLPDGSKAWLNAASSISFPTVFNQNKREVNISGEVYFEVSKKATPFIVKSNKGLIQVLGTHFNVMAYDDETAMETTLLEGSVKIISGNASRLLKPGQRAQSENIGEIKITDHPDVNEAIAWKTGLFHFNDAEIETVMRQISRWYDVDVKYEGKMPHKQITGKISRNVMASEVLSMLSYTGINFKIEGKNIIVMQ